MNTKISKIIGLKDLTPKTETDLAFSKLVKLVLNSKVDLLKNIKKSDLQKLQQNCAIGEYELEKSWAHKDIKTFPYYQNYVDLTKLEWETFQSINKNPIKSQNILFVGSGPLPLTTIILAQKYNLSCTIVDNNKEAVEISKLLIKNLNLHNKIKIIHSDAKKFKKYSDFNIIYLAALAGTTSQTKNAILQKIKKDTKKDTYILARSSWGNRRLLYNPIGQTFFKLFTPILEVHPHNHVVNSFIVFQNP